jgi:hypothetical protein
MGLKAWVLGLGLLALALSSDVMAARGQAHKASATKAKPTRTAKATPGPRRARWP